MKNDSKFKYSKEKLNEIRVFTFELSRTFFSRTTYFLSTSGVGIQKGDIIKTEYNGRIRELPRILRVLKFHRRMNELHKTNCNKMKINVTVNPTKQRKENSKKSMEEVYLVGYL